jgi:preprotein translocase subunit SecG
MLIYFAIAMATYLPIIQIVLSVLLIASILLQRSSATLGALGGSDNNDTTFHTRRGSEKFIFNGTIVLAILFIVVSFIAFLTA